MNELLHTGFAGATFAEGARFTAALVLIHEGVFWAGHFALLAAHRRDLWPERRFLRGSAPPDALMRVATRRVVLNHVLTGLTVAPILYLIYKVVGVSFDEAWPPPWQTALHLLGLIFISDTLFYWSHRLLHVPALFRRIHHEHHRFRYVRGVSAEYAHPVEDTLNLISVFAGAALLQTPVLVIYLWWVLRIVETLDGHSGYVFRFSPNALRHAYHHYAVNGCYGSFFSPWDVLMRTDAGLREWLARRGGDWSTGKPPTPPADAETAALEHP